MSKQRQLSHLICCFVGFLLLSAVPALADDCVADRGGLIDGFVNSGFSPADQH